MLGLCDGQFFGDNVARLSSPVFQSNTDLDVAVKVFADMISLF